jgi:2-oxoglutarate dehydrogenase E2 component (dihydrolipoamide succinyltransferase)
MSPEPEVIAVVMPQMGESLSEGTLVRWLKKAGDTVGQDEPLFEISTDKIDTEVPSSVAGVLKEILVGEGETVAVGTVVATVQPTTDEAKGEPVANGADGVSGQAPSASVPAQSDGHFKADRPPQLVVRKEKSSIFSPAVLDTARRAGLPLEKLVSLTGSGRAGRITKGDVERFLAAGSTADAHERPGSSSSPIPPRYLYTPGAEDRIVPMSPVRRQIADHMTWSARISPHATAFAECDMSAASSLLTNHRARLEADWGVPLTYTAVAAVAVVDALRVFPSFNASVVGDSLAMKPHVNLGIAVALEDTGELVVPVIHRAEELTAGGLAHAIREVADRARARRLANTDVEGGTFTLTNPGSYGGLTGTPILHQPQVGIIGVGAIVKRAVVVNDAIAIRPIMTMALTFDHRAADGILAFRFLDRVRVSIEERPLALDITSLHV